MKKIMAVLLSVAVLFAFAACDNSTVNPYFGKQVASVTLESTPDYLGGETINPADIELRVVYDDGTTAFITGDEAGLGSRVVGNTTTTNRTAKMTAEYGTKKNYSTGEITIQEWDIEIPVYAPVGLKIDTTNAAKVVEADGTISKEGLVFAVQYAKGTSAVVERPATIDELKTYGIELSTTIKEDDPEVDDEVTINVTVTGTYASITPELSATWKATVVADQSKIVKSVSIAQDMTKDIFNMTDTEDATKLNTVADLPYILTVTMGDDTVYTYKSTGKDDADKDYNLTKAAATIGGATVKVDFKEYSALTTKLTDKNNNFVATVTYTPKDGTEQTVKASNALTIAYTADYPITIKAKAKSDAKYDEGNEVLVGSFDFTVTAYASHDVTGTGDKLENTTGISITEATKYVAYGAFANKLNNQKWPVTFEWTGADRNQDVAITGDSVAINNPAGN